MRRAPTEGNNNVTTYATKVTGEGGASTLKRIVDISAGETSSVAINEFGWVYVWGNGTNGEFANGGTTSSNTPVKTVVNHGISASIGEGHVVALGQNGKLYTWGKNNAGQLGTGNTTNNTIVGKIAEGITDITAGGNFSIVKDIEGNIYGTGQNTNGEIGLGTNTNVATLTKITIPEIENTENDNPDDVGAVEVRENIEEENSFYSSILSRTTLGNFATQNLLDDNRPHVKYIKAGSTNTTIMLSDGTVWGAGNGTNGELGNGTNENTNTFVVGKYCNENISTTENDEEGTVPRAPTEGDNAEDSNVDALTSHISLLTSHASPLTSVLTIGRNIGGLNTAVILENGDVYATGDNTYLQISDNKIGSTNYYNKMEFICLDYADKEIEIDQTGYAIDKNKLKYLYETINVYNREEEKELTIGEIEYEPIDTSLIKVNQNGYITPLKKEGTTELKIKDKTNGYETKITIIVKSIRLQDTDTVTYIYNIDDLVRFRDNVNAGNDYAGKIVYVMEDIDMSPACSETVGSWTPIGATSNYFAGTFDGNYHTLSNLYYNSNAYINVGLFVQNNGVIQNLILDNANVYNFYSGSSKSGSVIGINLGKILNVGVINGSITSYQASSKFTISTGGIVGQSDGSINECFNLAKVTIRGNEGTVEQHLYGGGIVGVIGYRATITNCYNKGEITVIREAKEFSIGGIAGVATSNNIVQNCYNTGKLTTNKGTSSSTYLGGILGRNGTGGTTITIMGKVNNSYCSTEADYLYYYYYENKPQGTETSGRTQLETLKNYASTLGTAYENDDFNINEGYPILWWEAPTIELNKKQAYIKTGEDLQLEINSTVGARRTVPTTRECFNY